ncbi:hypothetical protein [Chitinophaga sp. MM2321]|uniref:hypothetical protein n=1 Tax=Chitinophaga sp. MM2321 TaxID=3137178 RepID=UPI0032D5957E
MEVLTSEPQVLTSGVKTPSQKIPLRYFEQVILTFEPGALTLKVKTLSSEVKGWGSEVKTGGYLVLIWYLYYQLSNL